MKHVLAALLSLIVIDSSAISASIVVLQNDHCGQGDGQLRVNASGGVPPYTYAWSSGGTYLIESNLSAGSYSVTVTDANSAQATANATVLAVDHSEQFAYYLSEWAPAEAYCPDQVQWTPFFRWSPSAGAFGPPPYTFDGIPPLEDPAQPGELYHVGIQGAAGEQVQLQFLDGNGCPGTFTVMAGYPVEWPETAILNVQGTCTGGSTGSITVAYPAELHHYSVGTEVRNMQDEIVVQGGYEWHGFQAATQVFSGLEAGDHRLIQRLTMAEGTMYYNACSEEVIVNIPDLGTACGNVNGMVYMDYNADCIMGTASAETRAPNALLEFTPGSYYTTATSGGAYSIDLPSGAYNVQQIATGIAQQCPPAPAPLSVSTGAQTINIADTALIPLDAVVMLASGPARPGFELHYAIQQRNSTPSSTGATSTVFTFDAAVSFIDATPAPSNVSGNMLTWNESALGAFQERSIQVRLQVPPNIGLIGTTLAASVAFSSANADADLTNNSASAFVVVTASLDPNEKVAGTSSHWSNDLYYIDVDQWVDYTLRFQNTGTDTAFTVIVTDTLPTTLDPASIQWGASSHSCLRSLSGQGILKFIFPNILLPDSNVNEAASHGFASFRIRPRLPLEPATEIENIANIFFDYNPPVITDPSVLTAEFSTGVAQRENSKIALAPVPASDELVVSSGDAMANVRILAADGREVMRMAGRSTQMSIDLSGLKSGAYLLSVELDNGTTARERFIKQ